MLRGTPSEDIPGLCCRRTVLSGIGVIGLGFLPGCSMDLSSGGPSYEHHEIDDGPVFAPGLQDTSKREYYATLIASADDTTQFDWERAGGSARDFVASTTFDEAYLGIIQVGNVEPSTSLDVVDLTRSDVNLTAVIAVRNGSPSGEDRVITTLLLRVRRDGNRVPAQIAVELDIGDQHETFTGG